MSWLARFFSFGRSSAKSRSRCGDRLRASFPHRRAHKREGGGWPHSGASAAAKPLLEFGGSEQIKEEVRDVYRYRHARNYEANLKSAFDSCGSRHRFLTQ